MIYQNPIDSQETVSLLVSVELSFLLNPHKDKGYLVRKVCTHARHRLKGNLKTIADGWRKRQDAYERYEQFKGKLPEGIELCKV